MKKSTKITIWVIVIVVIALIAYITINYFVSPGGYDDFAKCLTEKGIVMYGTDWCSYCQKQKALFGKSFEYVNYVNCDFNKEECNNAGVSGYPTWVIDGENYPGKYPLEYLSSLSDCNLK